MQIKHRIATAVATVSAAVVLGSSAFAAGSGYAPTPTPVPSGTPGGYTKVVTVVTISPSSGKVTIVFRIDGTPMRVVVLPHTFARKVQVVITEPKLNQVTRDLPHLGFAGYQAVAGFGFEAVNPAGHVYPWKFLKPVTVFLSNRRVGPGDRVLEWNRLGKLSTLPTPLFRPYLYP